MKAASHTLAICMLFSAVLTTCDKIEVAVETDSDKTIAQEQNKYLTTLRLDAAEGYTDADVIDMVERYSAVIVELGYPKLTYKLWKIYDESPAKVQTYLIEGNWPDRKVWEDIHLIEKYKGVSATFNGKFPTANGEMVHYTLLRDRLGAEAEK